jgi:hypothetical protein
MGGAILRAQLMIALILSSTLGMMVGQGRAAEPAAAASMKVGAATSVATPAPKLTRAQREFAAAFVSASNAKDIDAIRKLVAPEAVACFDKETQPFLDRWLKKQTRFLISTDYEASFARYTGGLQTSPLLTYPAKPTETMEIKFGAGGEQQVTMIRHVRLEKGKYYLVAACLTPEGVDRFRADEKKRDVRIAQAREISSKLQDPLLSQLRTLIKQKKVREALQLLRSNVRVDFLTARDVLLILADREPD